MTMIRFLVGFAQLLVVRVGSSNFNPGCCHCLLKGTHGIHELLHGHIIPSIGCNIWGATDPCLVFLISMKFRSGLVNETEF